MPFVRSSRQLPAANAPQRELFGFNLYRVLEAVLLGTLAVTPTGFGLVESAEEPLLRATAAGYLLLSLLLLVLGRRPGVAIPTIAGAGLALDIVAAALAMAGQQGLDGAIGLMLLFNISIGSLLLGPRLAMSLAVLAAAAVMAEALLATVAGRPGDSLFEPAALGFGYLAGAGLAQFLRRELAYSQALAEERGSQLVDLADLNELVIRRMRTGVLVVDAQHRLRLFNEAAWALLGGHGEAACLADLSPPLDQQLRRWRQEPGRPTRPLRPQEDGPELLPRFAAIGRSDELYLVFLDDSRLYSGHAEELTLATLGRLGASIAHEIRNPLSAILHAAQLLDESPGLPATERHLLGIIQGQCRRMDGIVESILGLARRRRAEAEQVPLPRALEAFVRDYIDTHPMGPDRLLLQPTPLLTALADPGHLQQVLAVLVDNARAYGHLPGSPARIELHARGVDDGQAEAVEIDVVDHGPGIAPAVAARLFEPFFTTSAHGTGLGLYIARQLCEANQGSLRFVPVAGGGACFRIRLPGRAAG